SPQPRPPQPTRERAPHAKPRRRPGASRRVPGRCAGAAGLVMRAFRCLEGAGGYEGGRGAGWVRAGHHGDGARPRSYSLAGGPALTAICTDFRYLTGTPLTVAGLKRHVRAAVTASLSYAVVTDCVITADSTTPVSSIRISRTPVRGMSTVPWNDGRTWLMGIGGGGVATIGAGGGGGGGGGAAAFALSSSNPTASVRKSESGGRFASAATAGSVNATSTWLKPVAAAAKDLRSNAALASLYFCWMIAGSIR